MNNDKNTRKLLELMQTRPDLPVIPIVDCRIVTGGDAKPHTGSLGFSYLGDYIKSSNGSVHFYLCDPCVTAFDMVPALRDSGIYTDTEIDSMSASEIQDAYDDLPWESAIIVNILP